MSRGTSKSSRCETSMGLSFLADQDTQSLPAAPAIVDRPFPSPQVGAQRRWGDMLRNRWAVLANPVHRSFHHGVPVSERRGHRPTAYLYFMPGVALSLPGAAIGQRFGDKATVAFALAQMMLGSLVMAFTNTNS